MFSIKKNTEDSSSSEKKSSAIDMSTFVYIHNPGTGVGGGGGPLAGSILKIRKGGMVFSVGAARGIGAPTADKKVSLNLSYSAIHRAFYVEVSPDLYQGYHFYKNSSRNEPLSQGTLMRTDTPKGLAKHKPPQGIYEALPDNPNIFVFKEGR